MTKFHLFFVAALTGCVMEPVNGSIGNDTGTVDTGTDPNTDTGNGAGATYTGKYRVCVAGIANRVTDVALFSINQRQIEAGETFYLNGVYAIEGEVSGASELCSAQLGGSRDELKLVNGFCWEGGVVKHCALPGQELLGVVEVRYLYDDGSEAAERCLGEPVVYDDWSWDGGTRHRTDFTTDVRYAYVCGG